MASWKAITVQISTPVAGSGEAGAAFASQYIELSAYSHSINAFGGYEQCDLEFAVIPAGAEDWLGALGYDVKVIDGFGQVIWEGFVDSVTVELGVATFTRGPLMDISNSVFATYQTPSYTIANTTIGGDSTQTAWYTDTESQDVYGALKEVISSGTASTVQAQQIAQAYLADNAEPKMVQTLPGSGGSSSIKLSCIGYYKWLEKYTYQQIVSAGTEFLYQKMEAALAADPNNILSGDYSQMTENLTIVGRYEDNDGTALDLISSLVSLSDSSFNRYSWGVYNDRTAFYAAMPTDVEYRLQFSDKAQRIVNTGGIEVFPWNVRPAKWLRMGDFLVGEKINPNLRKDPRMMLIESVQYTAPWGISLQGGRIDTITQKLARLGIGGIEQSF